MISGRMSVPDGEDRRRSELGCLDGWTNTCSTNDVLVVRVWVRSDVGDPSRDREGAVFPSILYDRFLTGAALNKLLTHALSSC
jgi:hypothetical protein